MDDHGRSSGDGQTVPHAKLADEDPGAHPFALRIL